jgi:hypothetical protein
MNINVENSMVKSCGLQRNVAVISLSIILLVSSLSACGLVVAGGGCGGCGGCCNCPSCSGNSQTNISYTVHYYLEGTSTKIADSKNVTGQMIGALITENAVDVAGYIAVAPTSVSGVLNATSNVFVFYYSANTVSYTVHYYLQDTSVQVLVDKVVYGQTLGAWVTEYAVEVWGYIAVAPTSVSGVLNATSNEFVFYYVVDPDAK